MGEQLLMLERANNEVKKRFSETNLKKEMDFLSIVGSYFCEEATVDFVQCHSGGGPQGEALKAFLMKLFPNDTTIILYDRPVKWVYGNPRIVKTKRYKK